MKANRCIEALGNNVLAMFFVTQANDLQPLAVYVELTKDEQLQLGVSGLANEIVKTAFPHHRVITFLGYVSRIGEIHHKRLRIEPAKVTPTSLSKQIVQSAVSAARKDAEEKRFA